MLSRKHVVAIAAVISVVLLTLTAWHRHTGADAAGSQPRTGPTSSTPASPKPSSPSSATRATATTATASSSQPSRTPTASSSTAKPQLTARQLSANLSSLFGGPADSFSVAGYDLVTGRTVSAGAGAGMTEASVVKLDILETALYHRQQTGYAFNEGDAEAMMENSDNAAADRVFDYDDGNTGLQRYNDLVGLAHTQLDPTETWGLSTTAAADQLTLLKQLISSKSILNPTSRGYALQLMGDVEADQQWGISAAADQGASPQLKNGWLNIDRDGGLWAVNSVGLTTLGGHRVLLVVLSQHQPDFQTGVNRVEAAARQLAAALRTG